MPSPKPAPPTHPLRPEASAPEVPAETPEVDPLANLTPEERAAHWEAEAVKWKKLSKKHEKRWRGEAKEPESSDPETGPSDHENVNLALLRASVRAEFKIRAPHLSDEDLDEFLGAVGVSPKQFLAEDGLNLARIDRLAARITHPAQSAAPAPEGDPGPGHRFNLGDITQRDSHKQKKHTSGSRAAAYERTRAKFPKK